jgi:tetratricopeptide (TPR) repeat protein
MRAVFWVVTLALPVVFFALLEGGLRLAGYGHDYPLFVPVPEHPEFIVQSRDVARRYFHEIEDAPTSLHDVFHARKPAGELRLFVQGGSSAAGFPFYHGAAFSRMLEARLQETIPERPVEVVNTAMAAVNTFTLLDLAPEILEQAPDAVLIYAGHNEYYGAFGVGSTESLGGSRALVNTYLRLRGFRTVQLLRGGLSRLASLGQRRQPGDGPSLMARMVGQQSIPYGSTDFERGLRQFRGNLDALLERYRRAGVPVFVATLAFNEREHPPFATVFQPETDVPRWRARLAEGQAALAAGDASGAARVFTELTRTDTLAAEGFFVLGRALEATGDSAAARTAYRAAADRDALRFRAPTAFNRIIRDVAAAHGATVVDVEARLAAAAPAGGIGAELMLEHLHPTVDGYFLLADAFYDALLASPLLASDEVRPVPASRARGMVRLTPADSVLGVARVEQLMAGWPFRPPGTPARPYTELLPLDLPEGRIALALLQGRMNWLEGTEELASELEREGRVQEAIRTREAMVLSYPMLPQPRLGLAGLFTRQRDLEMASLYYRSAIVRGEATGAAHGLLGAIELEQGMMAEEAGDRAEARTRYERSLALLEESRRLNPRNAQTLYNLSGAYAQLGRFDDARASVQQLLRVQPDHQQARRLLASLPD